MSSVCYLQYTRATHTYRESIKDVSVTLVPLAYEKTDNIIADTKKVSLCKNTNKNKIIATKKVKKVVY